MNFLIKIGELETKLLLATLKMCGDMHLLSTAQMALKTNRNKTTKPFYCKVYDFVNPQQPIHVLKCLYQRKDHINYVHFAVHWVSI